MGFTTRVKSEASEKKPFNFALFWDKYGTFFILAIIVAIFGSLSPEYFLTTNNITQIFVQSSVTVLIGMGEFFAILVAGIDLSVGAILALSGMVTAKLMLAGVDPFLAAMIGGVLVGGALGAINGCLVNWTGLHPFIITLGTNAIFRGITLVISDANSVYGFSFDFVNFFAASVIGIPVPVIFSLIVALILWFLTTRMRLGRNIYALGGNKNSAFYSGIDVKFHILVVFIISGVCAGLAGVVSTARLGAAEPLAGMGFETYAIASAIIGGTSFFGGKGRIFSVVIGGVRRYAITNAINARWKTLVISFSRRPFLVSMSMLAAPVAMTPFICCTACHDLCRTLSPFPPRRHICRERIRVLPPHDRIFFPPFLIMARCRGSVTGNNLKPCFAV